MSGARQMLEDLKQRLGRPLTTADVLMEFTDRANRGEPVDKDGVLAHVDEFLGDVPSKKRTAFPKNLSLAAVLVDAGKAHRKKVVRQMLEELQRTGEMTVDGVLCEFVDRVNRGKPVDKKELFKQVPAEMRAELAEELDFVQALLALGETYRKERTRRVSQRSSGAENPASE